MECPFHDAMLAIRQMNRKVHAKEKLVACLDRLLQALTHLVNLKVWQSLEYNHQ